MKIFSLLLLLALGTPFVMFSQKSDSTVSQNSNTEYKTIFSSNNSTTKVSGFGAFSFNLLSLDGKVAGAAGFDGAVLLNRSFYVGFYGRGSFGSPEYDFLSSDSTSNIEKASTFFHTGLIVGVNFAADKPIHFGFSTKFGGGAILLYDHYDYYQSCNSYNCKYYNDDVYVSSPVFVITPQIDVEMNLTNWMKFKVGLGYQWVSNSELSYNYLNSSNKIESNVFETGNLSSPTAEISFIFGWFK